MFQPGKSRGEVFLPEVDPPRVGKNVGSAMRRTQTAALLLPLLARDDEQAI